MSNLLVKSMQEMARPFPSWCHYGHVCSTSLSSPRGKDNPGAQCRGSETCILSLLQCPCPLWSWSKSLFGKSFSEHDEMLKQPRHFVAVGLLNNPDSDHHANTQQALPAASACLSSYPTCLSLLSIHCRLHVSTCHQTCKCILDWWRDQSSS